MRNPLARALVALAATLLFASAAFAGSLDSAKSKGLVGERPDGMVALVSSSAPGDVKALVDKINQERMAKYKQIARENDIPVDAVAARAGAKLVDRTPSGQYVFRGGKWVKK